MTYGRLLRTVATRQSPSLASRLGRCRGDHQLSQEGDRMTYGDRHGKLANSEQPQAQPATAVQAVCEKPLPGTRVAPSATRVSEGAPTLTNARSSTFRLVWAALFSGGHKTLAFEFAREVGLDDLEDNWFLHDGGPCPIDGSIKIKAVRWAEGGVHSWGIACYADDFTETQWAGITAFQVYSREDYMAEVAKESAQ